MKFYRKQKTTGVWKEITWRQYQDLRQGEQNAVLARMSDGGKDETVYDVVESGGGLDWEDWGAAPIADISGAIKSLAESNKTPDGALPAPDDPFAWSHTRFFLVNVPEDDPPSSGAFFFVQSTAAIVEIWQIEKYTWTGSQWSIGCRYVRTVPLDLAGEIYQEMSQQDLNVWPE